MLIQRITLADVVGIDVPLGWPIPLIEALLAHRTDNVWPAGRPRSFLFRSTDEWIREHAKQQPLAVAADRIAWPAVRAARLLAELEVLGTSVDRSGTLGKVIEVYPAAALARWSFRSTGYKTKEKLAVLGDLAEKLFARDWLQFGAGAREVYRQNDNALDALVASLVARAHHRRLCEPIPSAFLPVAKQEGWIALPLVGSLDQLPSSTC